MKLLATTLLILISLGHNGSAVRGEVTFDWATIGNPGNAADDTGFGSVDYIYRISKYEVTNAQYVEFLNAVAATDTNGLYKSAMGITTIGGITQTGSSGSYSYSVKADALGQGPGGSDYSYGNKPAVYVSSLDAMRFVNWLENGQPTGPQAAGTTEEGAYLISDGVSEVRDPDAKFFIPSEDEWHKAAYHRNDGATGNYWEYPTSSNSPPDNVLPSADTGNSANHSGGVGSDYPYSNVGAYTFSESPYGTFDQGGNVLEVTEGVYYNVRGYWGGGALIPSYYLSASIGLFDEHPSAGHGFVDSGLRIASAIPEPNCLLLFAASGTWLSIMRRQPLARQPEA